MPYRWHIECPKCEHKIDQSTQDKMWEDFENHMKENHKRKPPTSERR